MSERVHELKTWPEPFGAMLDGSKRFELRKDDRGFAVGDVLLLREWDPAIYVVRGQPYYDACAYTGRKLRVRVTYILHGGRFGLPNGMCVMGVSTLEKPND